MSAVYNKYGTSDAKTAFWTLTGAAVEADTRLLVYSDEADTLHEGVTGAITTGSAAKLVLTHASEIPAADYWVRAQAPRKNRSSLLKLSVISYNPETQSEPPSFSVSSAALNEDGKSFTVPVSNSYSGTPVWKIYSTASGEDPLAQALSSLALSYADGSLTVSSATAFDTIPGLTFPFTVYLTVTDGKKEESSPRTALVITPPKAPTPAFASYTSGIKNRTTAEYTLKEDKGYTEWKVYSGADGTAVPSGVTVTTAAGLKVILTGAPTLNAGRYYVTAKTASRSESERVQLTVEYTLTNGGTGSGKLVSSGPAASGAKTYYIDAENGDDDNDGLSPLTAWKSFKNPNAKTFEPGDHILLEADSIWNGETVTPTNYTTLLSSNTVGMLWPKGSGTSEAAIVIDLYDIQDYESGNAIVYYSANHRPIINGNGTPSKDNSSVANAYAPSGAVQLEDQSYWEIYNLEVTNTFADFAPGSPATKTLADGKAYGSGPLHWQKLTVPKGLIGISFTGNNYTDSIEGGGNASKQPNQRHITVKGCYVHDVQSESTNNKSGTANHWRSSYFGDRGTSDSSKSVGGIIADGSISDILIEGNIVRKVGLEGTRTGGGIKDNVVFRGNWVEYVMGDGIVLAGVDFDGTWQGGVDLDLRADVPGGLAEYNIVKDTCASPMNDAPEGTVRQDNSNYAAAWVYMAHNAVLQYNEAYGTQYGCLDGEAWDVDSFSDNVIYQYNYSHHNSGGCCLFMYDQNNSVFRYNLSANDGGGSVYMAKVKETGADALTISTGAYSYTQWPYGQSLFHYTVGATAANVIVPLIYNNTFFIGDGISPAIYGNTSSGSPNKYIRFYNNIIVKEDDTSNGTDRAIAFSNKHNVSDQTASDWETATAGKILNPAGVKNNVFWAYAKGYPETGLDLTTYFSNGAGDSVTTFIGDGLSNKYQNPKLAIQDSAKAAELLAQRSTILTDYNDPSALASVTSIATIRARASLLAPLAGSPVIEAGLAIPTTGADATAVSVCDTAWNRLDEAWYSAVAKVDKDLFGNTIDLTKPPVGAAAAPYPAQ